jgi:hypothetical protein
MITKYPHKLIQVVLCLMASLITLEARAETPPTDTETKASILHLADGFVVRNTSSFDWPSVQLIADTASGYRYRRDTQVKKGESFSCSESEFTKGSSRFDPRTMVIRTIYVYVPDHDAPSYEIK